MMAYVRIPGALRAVPPAAMSYLRERCDGIAHPGGTLLQHLERTAATLECWEAEFELVCAGLFHAAYGTEGFATRLTDLSSRSELVDRIGVEAEAIVYAYCSCDRKYGLPGLAGHADMRDRFSGLHWTPSRRVARALAELTAANELDVLEHATLAPGDQGAIVAWLLRCEPLLSSAAQAAVRRASFTL